jgi:ribonucleotide reductase alpha subunit
MAAVLTEKSRALLEKRYLYTDARGNKESIDGMFRRMSGGSDEYYELLTSLDALPNSPCFFNAHTGRGTVFACYTFYVSDSMSDGPDSIMGTADKAAVVAKWGGGVGYYLGNIRPKGSAVNSTHRKACGPCAVLRHYNSLGDLITQGGKRALAQIGILPAGHDDIEEFIDLKSDPQLAKTLANFNISAGWPDPWMEEVLTARPGKALDTFTRQVDRAWKTGCPGVWFPDTVNFFNETPYLGPLLAPNPCLAGDTLVYVADGRTAVPIRTLAEEGKDVPVFCLDDESKPTVRMLRRPRVTGYAEQIYKVTLDDGSTIRVTAKHKLRLRDGRYVEASLLEPGDSLHLATRYVPVDCAPSAQSYADRYVGIQVGGVYEAEHRLIGAFAAGREAAEGEHVHHKDDNRLNNAPGNLAIMAGEDHLQKHATGEANPNYGGADNDVILDFGRKLARSLGRRFSVGEWSEFARDNRLPVKFSAWREKSLGSLVAFSKRCAALEGVDDLAALDPRVVRTYRQMLEYGLDAEVVGARVFVHKVCEVCGEAFTVDHQRREQGICSRSCSNRRRDGTKAAESNKLTAARKQVAVRAAQLEIFLSLKLDSGREPQKAEWAAACKAAGVSAEISRRSSPFKSWQDLKEAAAVANHKVVSVEEDGREDVYNGTVDDFHNFYVGGWDGGMTGGGRSRQYWINNLQCGEVPLYSDEPCDLGSMNLVNFVTKNRTIDFTRLYERSRVMARYLDHLHDIDKIPVPQIRAASLLTRKTGLGVMGWADALCLLHVHYDTPEALALDEKVMACVNQAACDESLALAKKYGPFPGYDADRAAAPPYRNATRTCIAPTGSIYLIAGLDSSGIEPHYDTEWDRKTYDGMVLKEKVNAVERSGGFVPKTANEIGWQWHVDHQAAFQKHVSLACSKTVNLPEGSTRNDVASAYKRMWQKKCKGGTVYRNNCRSDQVLAKPGTHTFVMGSYDRVPSANGDAAKNPGAPRGAPGQTPPSRHRLPRTCQALRHKIEMPGFEGYLHVGLTSGGMPGEIFLTANKEGSTVGGLLDAWAKSVSMALQYGTPLEGLVKLHVGMRFEPSGATGCPDVPHACSLPDYVFRFLAKRFLGERADEVTSGDSGAFCPDCDAPALLQGGCLVCSDKTCGWSRCG